MRKRTYPLYGIAAVIVFMIAVALFLFFEGPDPAKYEFLKEPRITKMPDQKMLEVVAAGDPNVVGSKAFKLLFKSYFKVPGVAKNLKQAPRARWAGDVNVKSSWTGYYALPVPDSAASPSQADPESGYQVRVVTWEYGEVAEILHVGPYAEETTTIQKLHRFVDRQGYEIVGLHEEEYVKGPGMFFQGDPAKYQTIIRNRVRKRNL
ncbi:MAG TPA: hypothetical protein VF903_10240 [Nitrospirota bacterium]